MGTYVSRQVMSSKIACVGGKVIVPPMLVMGAFSACDSALPRYDKDMKAIVYEKYGPPDVLQLKEIDKPTPMDNEVLVKVHAASVNYSDWAFVRGKPFLVRLMSGLLKPIVFWAEYREAVTGGLK